MVDDDNDDDDDKLSFLSPSSLRLSRYMYAMGKSVWMKWKKRYFVLVQVSQYTFAICSYKEKKSDPSEMMQLDGYTVDYIEPAGGKCRLDCHSRLCVAARAPPALM